MAKKKSDKDSFDKELESLINGIRKNHGDESIVDLSSDIVRKIPRFTIESPAIADVLGPNPVEGGVPRGRIIEAFGQESAGKSSLSLYLASQIQNQEVSYTDKEGKEQTRHGVVAVVDAEHAMDSEYAATFGLDTSKIILSQPDSGEHALDIVQELAQSKLVDFIIVDSVSALTPQAEIEGSMSDQQMGLQARMMGKGMRKLTPVLGASGCTVMFINQIREKIGGFAPHGIIPTTTSGGKALKFYASVRLEVRKLEYITKGEETLGMKMQIKGVKNKTAPPMKKRELILTFGKGFDSLREWVDYAITKEVITRAGPYYTLPDGTKLQGKDAIYKKVEEDRSIVDTLKEKVRERILPSNMREEVVDEEPIEEVESDDIDDELEIDE